MYLRVLNLAGLMFLAASTIQAQTLRVELIEELTIGNDEEAAAEYLFAGPTRIQVGSQGRIYVADMRQASVRVFDHEGVYLTKIGSRGQGPGEISEIMTMTIDHNDDLVILDRMNVRFTRFSELGKVYESYPVPGGYMLSSHQMHPLGRDQFAVYCRLWDDEVELPEVIHLYDTTFEAKQESVVPRSDIWDQDEPFERALGGGWGKVNFVADTDQLLVAPAFYNGVIYQYVRTAGAWTKNAWKGQPPQTPPYTLLEKGQDYDFMINGSKGRFFAKIHNRSRGLFILSDGRIVHFTTRERKKKTYLALEVFEADGRLLGYGEVNIANYPAASSPDYSPARVGSQFAGFDCMKAPILTSTEPS